MSFPRFATKSKVLAVVAVVVLLFAVGCGGSDPTAGEGASNPALDTVRDNVLNESANDYYDNCQWSQGCGGDPNAFNGSDSNSVDGGSEIDPLP